MKTIAKWKMLSLEEYDNYHSQDNQEDTCSENDFSFECVSDVLDTLISDGYRDDDIKSMSTEEVAEIYDLAHDESMDFHIGHIGQAVDNPYEEILAVLEKHHGLEVLS